MLTREQHDVLVKKINNVSIGEKDDITIAKANTSAGQFSNVPLTGVTVSGEIQGSILNGIFNPLSDLIILRAKEIIAKQGESFAEKNKQINQLIQNHVQLREAMQKAIKESTEQELVEYKALQQQNQSQPTERMKELENQINNKIARITHIGEAVVADLASQRSDPREVVKNFKELFQNEFGYEPDQQLLQLDEVKQKHVEYINQLAQLENQIKEAGRDDKQLENLIAAIRTNAENSFNKILESDDNPAIKLKRMAGIQAVSIEFLNLISDVQGVRKQYENAYKEGQSMTRTTEDRLAETYLTWLEDRLNNTVDMYASSIDDKTGIDSETQKSIYTSLLASLKGVASHVNEEARRVNSQTAQTEQTQRISYEAESESARALKSQSLFARLAAKFNLSSFKSNRPPIVPAITKLQDAMTAASSKYSDHITDARKPQKSELSGIAARIRQKDVVASEVSEVKQPSVSRSGKR